MHKQEKKEAPNLHDCEDAMAGSPAPLIWVNGAPAVGVAGLAVANGRKPRAGLA